ncbi:MAG: diaminopimelate epimerase [Flavobacteriaceae bacterium]|tara:strand:- start:341 stop:1120 length:780 start_codon:yes stop_codon:yes gene_type:complete
MNIKFQKFQGTGNDFIIIHNKDLLFPYENNSLIEKLCDRKNGVGSDGLILINPSTNSDFEMVYYNSDGFLGSMCGNGARCSVKFAQIHNLINNNTSFVAYDGNHDASIENNIVSLSMKPVNNIKIFNDDLFLDTGSPHYVKVVEDIENLDVYNEGKSIRNNIRFREKGVNVNFVKIYSKDEFKVRTYERGVENETLSCGTGVTAVALAMFYSGKTDSKNIKIKTKGGELTVTFDTSNLGYTNIKLIGKVEMIFSGEIQI